MVGRVRFPAAATASLPQTTLLQFRAIPGGTAYWLLGTPNAIGASPSQRPLPLGCTPAPDAIRATSRIQAVTMDGNVALHSSNLKPSRNPALQGQRLHAQAQVWVVCLLVRLHVWLCATPLEPRHPAPLYPFHFPACQFFFCTWAMRGPPLYWHLTGIETATYNLSNCCSNHWATDQFFFLHASIPGFRFLDPLLSGT